MSTQEFFDRLQQQLDKSLPFVAYCHPEKDEVKAQLQQNSELKYLGSFEQEGFVFAPFDSDKQAVFFDIASAEVISTQNSLVEVEKHSGEKHFKNTLQEKTFHEKLVAKGIEAIKNSDLQKVVLSRQQQIVTTTNALQYFQQLLKTYPTAFVYCWYHPSIGLWLGATPETLLKTEGNRFKTMALAGTQAYKDSLEVEWNEKEIEEQAIVTRAITDELNSVEGVENLNISPVQTHRAGGVLHLKSDFTGTYKKEDLGKIIKSLHPTPAVCGLPKETAKNFIFKEEAYDRSFYTGYLGELNVKVEKNRNTNRRNVENSAYNLVKRQTNLYVNLRCMQLTEQKVVLYIGGGITKDSDPTAEWEETVKKAQTIQKVL